MNEQEYLQLIKTIQINNYAYYTMDEPSLTDAEYDDLYDKLVKYEEKNPEKISLNSPTRQVGGKLKDGLISKKHTARLYSLDKVKATAIEEIQTKLLDKIDNSEVLIEWKYDGLTVVLRYEEGVLVEGRTRGDGQEGEVITAAVQNISSIPKLIPYKKPLEIQGEIIVTKSGLAAYNEEQNRQIEKEINKSKKPTERQKIINKYPLLKNPRNAAAGSVRQLDMNVVRNRPLDAYLYNVLISEEEFQTQDEMLSFLTLNGFKVNEDRTVIKGLENIRNYIGEMDRKRLTLDFEVDGLTIKANRLIYKKLGHTDKFPRFALAYKFQPIEYISELLNVEWLVGRTGVITPRAIIKPVEINGTLVSKATLNNYEVIKQKGLQLGIKVYVRKTGEVIPEIIGAVNDKTVGDEIKVPKKCPVCASDTQYNKPFIMCNNENCEAKNLKKWDHFLSKQGLNIKGLAIKNIERFIAAGYFKQYADLYRLTFEKVISIEGYEKISSEKLLKEIKDKRNQTLSSLIYALGISEVGIVTAQKLDQHYEEWERFKSTNVIELKKIEDIGDKVAENIIEWLSDEQNIEETNELLKYVEITKKPKMTGGKLEGKKYVITGKFGDLKRSEIKERLGQMGAIVLDTVTKETDVLIAGENAGSKLEKASKLNVRVIGVEEYLKEVAI